MLKSLFNPIYVKKALYTLKQQINDLTHDPRKGFSIAYWYDRYLHAEPCVSQAFRDLCKPGDVIFDVGANSGDLSILASRLVGPKGIVCSFEASRRIVDKCQYNLIENGCNNTTIYHKAVYSESNKVLQVYAGSHHLNDTVVEELAQSNDFDSDSF